MVKKGGTGVYGQIELGEQKGEGATPHFDTHNKYKKSMWGYAAAAATTKSSSPLSTFNSRVYVYQGGRG